ncbi:MAG: DnaB-like helicase C-terminal domain-containing protein [Thermodesulfobacteriota bacterium]
MEVDETFYQFYQGAVPQAELSGTMLKGSCPFCAVRGYSQPGTLVVYLNHASHFCGYFRCLNRCVASGFAPHFARLAGLDPAGVPGHDPEQLPYVSDEQWPLTNINQDVRKFQASLTTKVKDYFQSMGVGDDVLAEMQIGFNGRYIVYPYFQDNGCAYAARCLSPDNVSQETWYGADDYSAGPFRLFNVSDINACADGSLFLVEGEEDLLCLRSLGFAGVAVPQATDLDFLDPARFAQLRTLFVVLSNSPEAEAAASRFAARLGFKVRICRWGAGRPRGFGLAKLARESGENFREEVMTLVKESKAFSPFATPGREYDRFLADLAHQHSQEYKNLSSGLASFDAALGGIHGINILGGAPKAGKSTLAMQLATQMAQRKVPVIYYDFENGRQKILSRTLARLSRVAVGDFGSEAQQGQDGQDSETRGRYAKGQEEMRALLENFRVVNDRSLTPELMRRHVDFLRQETHRDDLVVVIDSLHKLPFKDFSERRTGIDAWLRELEAIRDEMGVAFLVISELNRQEGGRYDGVPHMGLFKGSGDIEYTADNALVFLPDWDPVDSLAPSERVNKLWLVASREHSPGLVADYRLDYPYWGFVEKENVE